MDLVNVIFDFFYKKYYNEEKQFTRHRIDLSKKKSSIFI